MLQREVRGLHEAAYLLGFFALASQALALIRDRLFAHTFGASTTLDVYFAAFRMPDLVFVSVASLVSFSVVIPFFVEQQRHSDSDAKYFLDHLFTFFAIAMILVSGVLVLLAPWLLQLLFPGLASGEAFDELVLLTRILLVQPILLGFSSLLASVTQVYQKFVLYAVSPLLYNLGIISGVLVLYPHLGVAGLGLGVVLGALMHVGIQIPFLLQSGFFPRLRLPLDTARVRRVVLHSLPRSFALSAQQLALLGLLSLASTMQAGSIAIFNLSFNLYNVPLAIIGASYSVAAFPTLAKLFSKGERSTFLSHLIIAAKHIVFWSLPALVLFIVLRAQIVRVILGSGEFGWTDTRLTAAALALFAVSITAHSLMLLFVRGYYAAGETKKPLLINGLSAVLIVGFSALFLHFHQSVPMWQFFFEALLRVEGISGTHVLMLPLGYSLAMLITIGLFFYSYQRDFTSFVHALKRPFAQSVSASIIMGFASHEMLDVLDDVFNLDTFLGIFSQGAIAGAVGIAVGIAVLQLMGNQEIKAVWDTLHRKFWRRGAVAPDYPEL
jgi:putative peptidoglycan lipid II flippase